MGDALVVLSHSFWQTQFGGVPGVVGKAIILDRTPYTVVGVMPAEFEFYPKEIAMWRLMSPEAEFVRDPNNHSLVVFGRLRPGPIFSASLPDSRCYWRRLAFMALSLKPWLAARANSAYAWRWARPDATCSGWMARQGILLIAAGAAIGVSAAFALVRSLTSLLYDVKPTDPVTFLVVTGALSLVAFIATYIPARRAAKLDPTVAIRHE
jgi:hypothetical protein